MGLDDPGGDCNHCFCNYQSFAMAPFDLETFLPYRLYQAAEKTSQRFRAAYKEKYGLTRPEWRVLFNVGQYGPISASEIGERSFLHKTKISRAVAKLEQRRWLRRMNDSRDGRRHSLELTPSGVRALDDLRALAKTYHDELVAVLGRKKARVFADMLLRIEQCGSRRQTAMSSNIGAPTIPGKTRAPSAARSSPQCAASAPLNSARRSFAGATSRRS